MPSNDFTADPNTCIRMNVEDGDIAPDMEDVMTPSDFISAVENGAFVDDDGYGETNHGEIVRPSDVNGLAPQ